LLFSVLLLVTKYKIKGWGLKIVFFFEGDIERRAQSLLTRTLLRSSTLSSPAAERGSGKFSFVFLPSLWLALERADPA
jgi:hypothetical protein